MGWWPDRITRLFRNGKGRMTEAAVHEAVDVSGQVAPLESPIEHYTESRLGEILKKIDRYSTLAAEEAFRQGRRSSAWGALARAELTFVQDYVLRLGFLDGRQGLVLSVTDAVNKFFKYAKLSELNRLKDGSEGKSGVGRKLQKVKYGRLPRLRHIPTPTPLPVTEEEIVVERERLGQMTDC
jgi:hypothetical protein